MKKDLYILGINDSHGATAALLKNGEIIAVASEERFTRKKNESGYPKQAIAFCLKFAGITAKDLAAVCFGYLHPIGLLLENHTKNNGSYKQLSFISNTIQKLSLQSSTVTRVIFTIRETVFKKLFLKKLQRQYREQVSQKLHIDPKKIHFLDHQTAHGYAAYYANPKRQPQSIVITCDGAGDAVCSRIFAVNDDKWKRIGATPNTNSLGLVYLYVTQYLGMKPNEHEYKVMGLAPYAHGNDAKKVLSFFRHMMTVDGITIRSRIPHLLLFPYLQKHLTGVRFDLIAAGIQLFTEQILTTLVKNAITKTKVQNITLGGGVFMNVKANMQIAKLSGVKNLFVMPCSTDESVAIGAAYFSYHHVCQKEQLPFSPKPLQNLYLGPSYQTKEIETIIRGFKKQKNITSKKMQHAAKEVAQLLAQGEIVARFSGRMEYGARALGNRSILARADAMDVVRIINDQIKSRDFWMPFAPLIRKERNQDYLINPKKIDSPFMMLAFETTQKARQDLIAAIHPYDQTARPQILSEEQNPSLYALLKEFETLTGMGGILNTSFNIHGEPIVCSPLDAVKTFQNSGLKYLVLENYLLTKR